ncbi:hypothetical protein PAMP_024303 [Pampus punctatissimus]
MLDLCSSGCFCFPCLASPVDFNQIASFKGHRELFLGLTIQALDQFGPMGWTSPSKWSGLTSRTKGNEKESERIGSKSGME